MPIDTIFCFCLLLHSILFLSPLSPSRKLLLKVKEYSAKSCLLLAFLLKNWHAKVYNDNHCTYNQDWCFYPRRKRPSVLLILEWWLYKCHVFVDILNSHFYCNIRKIIHKYLMRVSGKVGSVLMWAEYLKNI